nr:replication initiation protein [Microvirus sp.]
MCTSPLYRCSKNLLAFYNKEKPWEFPTALYNKLFNKGYAIVGWREYLDYKKRFALPEWGFTMLPCGRCTECRIRKVKEWSVRCLAEKKTSRNAWFLTLTYNDDNLHFEMVDGFSVPVLEKRDCQLFFKRLRKALFGSKKGDLRYFLSGEYGDSTLRPHYHAIIYNLDIPDLEIYKVVGKTIYYKSEFLNKIWGLGYVVVGRCNSRSTVYTCSYTMKKVGFLESPERCLQKIIDLAPFGFSYELLKAYIGAGVLPRPFSLMSRRKAIGRQYFDDNIDGVCEGLPDFDISKVGYYDDKLKEFDEELFDELKDKRSSIAEAARRQTERALNLPEELRFLMKEKKDKPEKRKSKL